ncbi:MAG: ATP-dependent DNA helicase PcrA [Spirochaetae bacterium HGW-Spirochaetae-1]|jgi:DNA helicase-2/ATP-dependent DNA helicase PcrA|nr:MAG: ATP-dependent DNA helicase PcrA [Spirochaetae bacterium HGW-Spirochaetae-1]
METPKSWYSVIHPYHVVNSYMDLLSSLNDNQKNAVIHTEGPLLILAGAGSGKTRVITHRIAHLIRANGIPPYAIFAVTFTNKAAEEMKTRIINLIGPEGNSVFIKTFHSASVYILRRFGDHIAIPRNFSIFDQSDQTSVVKEILMEMKLDPKKIKPSMIVSRISEVKDKASLLEGAAADAAMPDHFAFNFQEVYNKYHEIMASQNALDFNDLLIKTVELLRSSPETLQTLQRQWRYFMIDEYQDTNYAQYLIARYLASATKNICVVGDDDQSIYSWRGADIRNILDFEKDYQNARVITLRENYRSTEPILNAASSVIRNNLYRKEKDLEAQCGDGEPVVHCQTNNEYGEAEYVVNTLISLKHREKYRNKDFSIFYRTNAQSRLFEEQLRRQNIPYRVIGGLKFYDRKEIKDIVAYLRFVVNPKDTVSLLRIINTPSRGVGKATIDRIMETARQADKTPWEVIRDELLTGKVPKGLDLFRTLMKNTMEINADVPARVKLSTLANDIIELSGYRRDLQEEKTSESTARLENLDEFINSVFDYENANPEALLQDFLQDISLLTSEDTSDEEIPVEERDNTITLMTVHNAKGLEFPVVFLTGMEENTFPHKFSIDSEEGIEEERRLCYVGITRAKERIFITNAEIRRSFLGVEYREPSRFIGEIPESLKKSTYYNGNGHGNDYGSSSARRSSYGSASPAGGTGSYGTISSRSLRGAVNNDVIQTDKPVPVRADNELDEEASKDISRFRLRERVMHPRYGSGIILNIEGTGDNIKLTINFTSGRKTFLEKYTPLEKID